MADCFNFSLNCSVIERPLDFTPESFFKRWVTDHEGFEAYEEYFELFVKSLKTSSCESYKGAINGFGVKYHPYGPSFGFYVNDILQGWGCDFNYTRSLCIGHFIDGKLNGQGVLYCEGLFFSGEFKDGMLNGMGYKTYKRDDQYIGHYFGEHEMVSIYKEMKGDFNDDKLDGIGEIKFRNGDLHKGIFKDNKLDGIGEILFKNGDIYRGEFKDGLLNGIGKKIFYDGTIETGVYENNSLKLEINSIDSHKDSNSEVISTSSSILFIDTETTGLPNDYSAPASELNNWPRLVSLAFIVYDYDGNILESGDFIVKPNGFEIPFESSAIHGIDQNEALSNGIELRLVLDKLSKLLNEAYLVVGHNIDFDLKILEAELIRNEVNYSLSEKQKLCTMLSSTEFCGIIGHYGFKYPKLNELYYKLFNKKMNVEHNAAQDIKATAECFWELIRIKQIDFAKFKSNNEITSELKNKNNSEDQGV